MSVDLGEKVRSVTLDAMNLKCLLGIQVELLSRQLVFGVQWRGLE